MVDIYGINNFRDINIKNITYIEGVVPDNKQGYRQALTFEEIQFYIVHFVGGETVQLSKSHYDALTEILIKEQKFIEL